MKTLKLTLNKGWFDMILTCSKCEEYREIKPYWIKRLINFKSEMESAVFDEFCNDLKNPLQRHDSLKSLMDFFDCEFIKFDRVEFTNGYSKQSPQVTKDFLGIDVGVGLYVWGSPNIPVFKITLGKEVARQNC